MDIRIRKLQPDGLEVILEGGFIFDTWEEAFSFIIAVEKANGWQGDINFKSNRHKR